MARGCILFISDLHLDAAAPATIELFRSFLRREAAASDGLYILGDLFETWIGDDDDEPARAMVCDALRSLVAGGVPCRVMHGNRDFLLDGNFAARTGCELLADPLLLQRGGKCIVLTHGDQLCTGDVGYQRFRRLVRSRFFLRTFPALPLRMRRWLAGKARRRSYAHTRQLPESIMDVTPQAVETLFRETGADLLIHGHTHRPDVHQLMVDGRPRTRVVLGDWHGTGNCLALDAAGNHECRTLLPD
jgi:UDP-2,3-diacylglucosamine hydrolase